MTSTGHRWEPKRGAWALNGAVATILLLSVATRLVSPAIALDMAALWPVGVLLLAAGWVLDRVWASKRDPAFPVMPLLVFTWLVIASSFYFAAEQGLPSHSADLTGPPISESDFGVFTAELGEGVLELAPGIGTPAYRVNVIRRGGGAGIPVAIETAEETAGQVAVVDARKTLPFEADLPISDNPLLRFAGWRVLLNPESVWSVTLSAPEISADVSEIKLERLVVNGSGTIRLGETTTAVEVELNGTFDVETPAGTPAEVRGTAVVPEEWTVEEDRAWTGERGTGWMLYVNEGGSTQIVIATG